MRITLSVNILVAGLGSLHRWTLNVSVIIDKHEISTLANCITRLY